MALSPEQYIKWTRYGMDPYNWVVDKKIIASVYPKDEEYLFYLRKEEGIRSAVNLSEHPWPDGWMRSTGIECFHFPIIDMSVPSEDQVRKILEIINDQKDPLMIHCAAGIGRTGTLIALYLVDRGMECRSAIELVRQKRNGSIQTTAQEGIIHDWAKMKGDSDGS